MGHNSLIDKTIHTVWISLVRCLKLCMHIARDHSSPQDGDSASRNYKTVEEVSTEVAIDKFNKTHSILAIHCMQSKPGTTCFIYDKVYSAEHSSIETTTTTPSGL